MSLTTRLPRRLADRCIAKGALCVVWFAAVLGAGPAGAVPRQIGEYHWERIDRIVAIGDIHGDERSYRTVLRAAGVIDDRGRWIGGETHLVQIGDIPDRGPDTRAIIAHMAKLARQAEKHGGRVHNLMGNHEAMNVYGDLHYVTDAEFAAFADRGSARLRDRYFAALLKEMERRNPEDVAALPADFSQNWYDAHPLGWLEHRAAWNPGWNPEGELYRWVMQTKVAVKLNEIIFLHGGISSRYCRNTLESLTLMAREALSRNDLTDLGILVDKDGPLWYRGLAGVAPEATPETVLAILEQHGARHIVIGHTVTGGVILPRYDSQVIQIDVGLSAYYGGNLGYLEITGDGVFAGYREGKIRLPDDDAGLPAYFAQVMALDPENAELKKRLADMMAPSPAGKAPAAAGDREDMVICGIVE